MLKNQIRIQRKTNKQANKQINTLKSFDTC